MKPELSESEYFNLFIREIQVLKFSVEQLGKMLENRLDALCKFLSENDLNKNEVKDSRKEINHAIEGYDFALKAVVIKLQKFYEESLNEYEQKFLERKSVSESKRRNFEEDDQN